MHIPNTSFTFFNAQVAFYCLLKAFGIGKHDRVLLPGYINSFIPQTVCQTSAIPEYTDISLKNYNSLLTHYRESHERAQIAGTASSLAAILIHHTYGSPNPDTEKIVSWASEKGLKVIEYCAYAPQLADNGKAVGTSGDGSFFTFGFQGIVQVNNPKYLNIMAAMEKVAPPPTKSESLSLLANYFTQALQKRSRYVRLLSRFVLEASQLIDSSAWRNSYEASPREFFKGVCRIQRRMSKNYANRFDTIIHHRKQLAAYYSELLKKCGFPSYEYQEGAILAYYPVRVKSKQECLSLANALGFELGKGLDYTPYNADENGPSWDECQLPGAVSASQEVVCLPLHEQIDLPYAQNLVSLLDCIAKGVTYNTEASLKGIGRIPYATTLLERLNKKAHFPTQQY